MIPLKLSNFKILFVLGICIAGGTAFAQTLPLTGNLINFNTDEGKNLLLKILILDVSRYKYPPVWVKTEDLWKAMNTVDSTSGKTRGFVFVSKN